MDFYFMGFRRFLWISNTCKFESISCSVLSRLLRRMLAAQESTDEILHDLDSMVRAVTYKMLNL